MEINDELVAHTFGPTRLLASFVHFPRCLEWEGVVWISSMAKGPSRVRSGPCIPCPPFLEREDLCIVHGQEAQGDSSHPFPAPSKETPVPPRVLSFSPRFLDAPGPGKARKHRLPHLQLSRGVLLGSSFGDVHRTGDASISAMAEK